MLPVILIILSFASLLIILLIDLFFYCLDKPVYMTNQSHINLYILPFFLSFIFFYLAVTGTELSSLNVIIFLLFTGFYIFILSEDKVILIGANMEEVLDVLDGYLKESGRTFRVYPNSPHLVSVEINNYPNALTVRNADQWIEIDNHLHYDEAFVNELFRFFSTKTKEMKSIPRRPHFLFYVLILAILVNALLILQYYI